MTTTVKGPLKILQLQASNFQRLTAVEITPKGNVVTITGRNDNGKTSCLNAIWAALENVKVGASMPIRRGANKAVIRLDLGEIVVERRFTKSGTTLAVESADGAAFKSAQTLLSSLLGALAFDPTEFARMKPREQYDALRGLVKLDVDIDKLKAQNEADYAKRTLVNRDVAQMKARVEAIVIPAVVLPAAPVDESALLDEIQMAGEANTMLERRRQERAAKQREAESLVQRAADNRRQAAALRNQADEVEAFAAADLANSTRIMDSIAKAPAIPEPIDTAALRAQLEGAKQTNASIGQRTQKLKLEGELGALEGQSQALTDAMEARVKVTAEAIERAKMPVPGLGFGEGEVLLNGVPFDQASTAVQLKTSLAIAMQANPTIRVIRIQHGNDLDEQSMEVVAKMAEENDYQVWVERVDSSGKIGVYIEDGHVAAVDGVPVAQEQGSPSVGAGRT